MTSPQTNPVLSSIDLGVSLLSNEITVYFAQDGEKLDFVENQGDWSAYAKAQAMAALEAYAAVADLSFSETDDAGAATFKLTKSASEHGSLGFMNPPYPEYGDSQGIAWFNSYSYWSDASGGLLDPGSYMFTIFLHEFGHGLGLAHPFDESGTSTLIPAIGAGMGLDQGVYTVMTYNDGWPEAPEGLPDSRAWGWNLGPSAIDIAVIQAKYGVNTETGAGKTRYELVAENTSGSGYLAIWDVGGRDTIVHNGTAAATIDLRAATLRAEEGGGGYVSHVSGIHGGFTIANGVVIERAIGGAGDDTITGNAANNLLNGRGGADTMTGRAGDDTFVLQDTGDRVIELRGEGYDTVRSNRIDLSLRDHAFVEAADLRGNRDLEATGSAAANRLSGNSGDNRLSGGAGHDTLTGGAGDDRLIGGKGRDVLEGGVGADVLLGGKGNDTLSGGRGRDLLTGGAGADSFVIAPGDGRDRITDFTAEDLLDLTAFDLDSFATVQQALSTEGDSLRLDLDGAVVILDTVDLTTLGAEMVLI